MDLPQPSPITPKQKKSIFKALAYSTASGFTGGLLLSLSNVLSSIANGGHFDGGKALGSALIIGGTVGAINGLIVTVKQVFSDS